MGMRGSGFFNNFNNNSGMDIVIGQKPANAIGPSVITGIQQNVPGQMGQLIQTKIGEISTNSPFKYPLEQTQPSVKTQAGQTIMADSPHFPALKGQGQAVFSITLKQGGSREPHWHQHAGECHFVAMGTTRYLVMAPGGQSELADLNPGEFFYAPPGYAHMFENVGNSDLHVISFWTDDNPGDVGVTGGMSSYSDAVLGATFRLDPAVFAQMKRYNQDQGIVGSPGSTSGQVTPNR
jgi:oxalate decarboxylase/phosphoglucose isomerase-like protein (cupin superfamily)